VALPDRDRFRGDPDDLGRLFARVGVRLQAGRPPGTRREAAPRAANTSVVRGCPACAARSGGSSLHEVAHHFHISDERLVEIGRY